MDGKQFWNKVDALLRHNNITVTELASLIGQSRNTLFVQRARATIPKIDQIKRMETSCSASYWRTTIPVKSFFPT